MVCDWSHADFRILSLEKFAKVSIWSVTRVRLRPRFCHKKNSLRFPLGQDFVIRKIR